MEKRKDSKDTKNLSISPPSKYPPPSSSPPNYPKLSSSPPSTPSKAAINATQKREKIGLLSKKTVFGNWKPRRFVLSNGILRYGPVEVCIL